MLVTVHQYPNGDIYRSGPLDDDVVERWIIRSRAETGYLGHKYWAEDLDGNTIEEE